MDPPPKDTAESLFIYSSLLFVRILFVYFIPQTAKSQSLLSFSSRPWEGEKNRGGKTPHVTKHTESKEPLNRLLGEHERWTQCRPKSLPLLLGVASSGAVQLPNLKSLLVFRSPVEWGGGSTLAPICSLVHPLLPVGPQQGATCPPPALVSSSVKCMW